MKNENASYIDRSSLLTDWRKPAATLLPAQVVPAALGLHSPSPKATPGCSPVLSCTPPPGEAVTPGAESCGKRERSRRERSLPVPGSSDKHKLCCASHKTVCTNEKQLDLSHIPLLYSHT